MRVELNAARALREHCPTGGGRLACSAPASYALAVIPVYPAALAGLSAFVFCLERAFPWRKSQRILRPSLLSDAAYIVFNGHVLGVWLATIASRHVIPALEGLGLSTLLSMQVAAEWPVPLQIVACLLLTDFMEWCVHNVLHRVPWLWSLHQVHHSVVDGEMDFIVSFRFHFAEIIVYRTLKFVPLTMLGFGEAALLSHAIIGTLVGHLNHANLNLSWGPGRYILNSPRMHLWHHDFELQSGKTVNFGIIFSVWDWIFGTAYLPESSPARLGFDGVERFPRGFLAQEGWPWVGVLRPDARRGIRAAGLGAAVLSVLALLAGVPQCGRTLVGDGARVTKPVLEQTVSSLASRRDVRDVQLKGRVSEAVHEHDRRARRGPCGEHALFLSTIQEGSAVEGCGRGLSIEPHVEIGVAEALHADAERRAWRNREGA